MSRARLTLAALAAAALAGACRGQFPRPAAAPMDPEIAEWGAVRDTARAAIVAGRYARADSVLTAFRARYPNAPESAEALYWRAVARFDAPEPAGGVRPAIADLEAYRTSAATGDHMVEALALRRALVRLDSARATNATAAAPAERPAATPRAGMVPRDSLRVRDEELQRVRAEAAAAQAELDRLRRRLAAPARRP